MDIYLTNKIKAKQMIDEGIFSLVIAKEGELLTFSDSGVRRLMIILDTSPDTLKGAYVCDKIVGKAAAALLVLGGAKSVYAKVISGIGLSFLQNNGIQVEYGQCVERIINRTGDGYCPIEQATLNAVTATEAYSLIKEKLKQLALK